MDELETSSKAIEDMNATEAAGSSLMPEGLGTDSDALAWLSPQLCYHSSSTAMTMIMYDGQPSSDD